MKPKITLCMIVKNETHIIKECLRSIAPYIDRYDITDTGSTDGTQELIKTIMNELGIPGEVHQSDWKGFGDHAGNIGSRTEAFRNAEKSDADYAWVIDADDYIEGNFAFPPVMDADAYSLKLGRADFTWWRNQIFKLSSKWSYRGILHEYALSAIEKEKLRFGRIDGNYRIIARTQGARNIGITPIEKYKKDAEVLEKALLEEPNNDRYVFYLAQSYFDSQQWEKSYEMYMKRAEMGGWPEEVYYSKLRCGIVMGMMNKPPHEVAQGFLEAFSVKPDRAEPLWFLSRMYRNLNMPAVSFVYASMGAQIPYPKNDILFIQEDVYKWGILDEIGATAFYAGKPEIGYNACRLLLENNLAPKEHEERIKTNLNSYINVLSQIEGQKKANNARLKEQERQQKRLEKNKRKTKTKSSTRVPPRSGFKPKK